MEDGVSKYAECCVMGVIVSAFCYMLTQEAYGLEESTGPGGSNCAAVHQLGETGEGVNVGLILAGNVRATHEASRALTALRMLLIMTLAAMVFSIIAHDTQLAGIVASRGGTPYPMIRVLLQKRIYIARVLRTPAEVFYSPGLSMPLTSLLKIRICRVIVTGFELTGIDPMAITYGLDFTIITRINMVLFYKRGRQSKHLCDHFRRRL